MAQSRLRVLATGASGLIGKHLLKWHEPKIVFNVVHGFSSIPLHEVGAVVQQAEGMNSKIILHLAWPGSSHRGDYKTTEDNLIAKERTLALARACQRSGIKLVVAGSGADDKPIPGNLYVSSKYETREALRTAIIEERVVWLRPFNVFDGSSWPSYLKTIKSGKVIPIIDNRPRDFIHVDDVCSGVISVILAEISGYVDLGSGIARTPSMLISAAGGVAEVMENNSATELPKLPLAKPPYELSDIWTTYNTSKFFGRENDL